MHGLIGWSNSRVLDSMPSLFIALHTCKYDNGGDIDIKISPNWQCVRIHSPLWKLSVYYLTMKQLETFQFSVIDFL